MKINTSEFKIRWMRQYIHPDYFKLPVKLPLIPHVDVTFIMRHNHWEEPPDPSLGTYAYPMFRIYDSDGNIIYSTTNTNGECTATVPLIVGKRYKFVEIRSDPQCFLADDYEFIVTPDTTEITIMHEVKYYLLRLCIDNNYNFGYYDENPDVLGGTYDYEFNSASIVGRIGIEIYKHNKDGSDTLQGKYFPAIDVWGCRNGTSKWIAKGLSVGRYYPPVSPDVAPPCDSTRIWAIGGGTFINASTSYKYVFDNAIIPLRRCFLAQRNIPIKFELYALPYIAIYIESFSYGWAEDINGNVIDQEVFGCGATYEDALRLAEIASEEMRVASEGATSNCGYSGREDIGIFASLNPQPETIDIYTGAGVYKTIPYAEYTDGMTYATYSDIISNHDYVRASTSDWIKMFGGEYEYNPNYT